MILISIAVMAFLLKKSLKKTVYSYLNIGLIGGIIFASVLEISLFAGIIKCAAAGDFSYKYFYRLIIGFPRDFSFYAMLVIFLVSVLVGISNIALMHREGYRLHNALSLILAGIYVGGTVGVYFFSEFLEKYIFASDNAVFVALNTAIPLFLLLALCYFECILAGTAVMGYVAARQKPDYDRDFIIILGCSIDKKGGLLPLLKGRVNRAIRFAWEQEIKTGKALKYVPSGGKGANEVMSEGSAMELYLMTRGAEAYEIIPEKESRNTFENMKLSKKLIDEAMPDAKIAFATTNYHMLRSGILARMAGIDAQGIAGDTKWYFWPNGFVREFFGIISLHKKVHIAVLAACAIACAAFAVMGCLIY